MKSDGLVITEQDWKKHDLPKKCSLIQVGAYSKYVVIPQRFLIMHDLLKKGSVLVRRYGEDSRSLIFTLLEDEKFKKPYRQFNPRNKKYEEIVKDESGNTEQISE